MSYDGVLFDHDGVLVRLLDRETLADGLRRHAAFDDAGADPDPELLDVLNVGVDREELLALADRRNLDPETLWRHRDDALETTLREATRRGEKRPYADVDALADLDVPLGVVSNNQRRVVEFVLDRHDLRNRFDTVRAREPRLESIERKKPAPTYVRQAMADLGLERPLYVGDSESDVLAGHRAGVDVALLRRDHNADLSPPVDPSHEVTGLGEVTTLLDGDRPARSR